MQQEPEIFTLVISPIFSKFQNIARWLKSFVQKQKGKSFIKFSVQVKTKPHLNFSHFTMEVTQETFDALNYYVASTDHLVLQHLLNTSLEIVIMNNKLEKDIPFVKPKAAVS